MPRQAQDSMQCVFAEGNRRCRRTGTGDPAVCQAHRIAFEQAAKGPATRGEAIFDVLDSWISGRRVSKKKARAAAREGIGAIRDIFGRAQPGVPVPGVPRPAAPRAPRPPPPPDPLVEAKRRFLAAKVAMGFAESEPITADDVKSRHRELVKRYHPDRAGRDDLARKKLEEQMIRINAARDELLANAA